MHDRCVITESSLVVPQRHPFQAASISTLRESCGAGSCDHASRRYFAPKARRYRGRRHPLPHEDCSKTLPAAIARRTTTHIGTAYSQLCTWSSWVAGCLSSLSTARGGFVKGGTARIGVRAKLGSFGRTSFWLPGG